MSPSKRWGSASVRQADPTLRPTSQLAATSSASRSCLRQSVIAACLAIAEEAEEAEAERHHRPCAGFGDSGDADFERKVLVRPLAPRPFVVAGRHAKAAEGLAGICRGVRQQTVRDVARWYFKIRCEADDADYVSAAAAGNHKGKAVRQAIRSAGAKLFFLPKYSPDLNPIEQVFAKLKHLLRKAAARNLEALVAATGELLGAYTARECANYFANAGYGQA